MRFGQNQDPGRWRRRVVSIPAELIACGLVWLVPPVFVPMAALADLVLGRWRFGTVRLALLVGWWLSIDAVAIVLAGWLWLRYRGHFEGEAAQRVHRDMQSWWMKQIAAGARRAIGLHFDVIHLDALRPGPIIAIARHASYGDAILPALLLGAQEGLHLRYVLMRGLRWEPALDLYGSRLPNHFVERTGGDHRGELAAIHALTLGLDEQSAAVIFPEGRFFTPGRSERAVAALRADQAHLADRAAALRYLLPARPGGLLAMLEAAPQADVVVISHVGFERYGSAAQIWRNVPFRHAIRVETRRIDRSTVPVDRSAQVDWLYREWTRLDAWIAANIAT